MTGLPCTRDFPTGFPDEKSRDLAALAAELLAWDSAGPTTTARPDGGFAGHEWPHPLVAESL